MILHDDSVAQLVEQVTLNHWVVSSSLTGVTSKTSLDLRIKARRFLPSPLYNGIGYFLRYVSFPKSEEISSLLMLRFGGMKYVYYLCIAIRELRSERKCG